jgi:hypothetical protein
VASRQRQAWPARAAGSLLDHLFPRRPTGRLWHRDRPYPVYRQKRAVPWWVWRRPDLLVQRFLPESAGARYVHRVWYFFADVDFHMVRYGRDPFFPPGAAAEADLLGEVPAELRALRASWGFDFGKFDYLMPDGKPMVLDANKTPSFGLDASPFHRTALPRLASGIEHWL